MLGKSKYLQMEKTVLRFSHLNGYFRRAEIKFFSLRNGQVGKKLLLNQVEIQKQLKSLNKHVNF